MRWEYDKLNSGLVIRPKSLRDLLTDPDVGLESRGGERYHVDRNVLEGLAAACSPREQAALRLPITVQFSADIDDSAYVSDELAAEVLHRMEGWGTAYPHREGRMWIPQSLAVDLILRYGGALQRLML